MNLKPDSTYTSHHSSWNTKEPLQLLVTTFGRVEKEKYRLQHLFTMGDWYQEFLSFICILGTNRHASYNLLGEIVNFLIVFQGPVVFVCAQRCSCDNLIGHLCADLWKTSMLFSSITSRHVLHSVSQVIYLYIFGIYSTNFKNSVVSIVYAPLFHKLVGQYIDLKQAHKCYLFTLMYYTTLYLWFLT